MNSKITIPLSIRKSYVIVTALFAIGIILSSLLVRGAFAAATTAMVRFDRMATSTATTGTVCLTPATAGTAASVVVTFPTGYTVSGTTGNWTVSTTNLAWPSGGTAWPGIGTASAVAGQAVTFPSTTLTVGTLYCFNWTNTAALTTSSSATNSNTGTIVTQTSAPATIDSAGYATATVSNDQIAVSATVPNTFSFALSANTDSLGTLSTGSVSTSPTPRTATVNTNAKNGWTVWAKDANTGIRSTNASYTVASTTPGSNSTLSAGTEGYNLGVTVSQTSGSQTPSVVAGFVGGSLGKGGGLNTSLAAITSSTGTANNAVLTLNNNVAINGTTPAATDYADTLTFVAAGLF